MHHDRDLDPGRRKSDFADQEDVEPMIFRFPSATATEATIEQNTVPVEVDSDEYVLNLECRFNQIENEFHGSDSEVEIDDSPSEDQSPISGDVDMGD